MKRVNLHTFQWSKIRFKKTNSKEKDADGTVKGDGVAEGRDEGRRKGQ